MKEKEKIPFEEALRRLYTKITDATYSVKEAAELLGLSIPVVRSMLKAGNIKGAYKENARWVIPAASLELSNIQKRIDGGAKPNREKYTGLRDALLENNMVDDGIPYLFLDNVVQLTGMSRRSIMYHCARGNVDGAKQTTMNGWMIPKKELDNLIRLRDHTVTAALMASLYDISAESLIWHCKAGRVPNASYDPLKKKWLVPLASLEKINWNVEEQGISIEEAARRTGIDTEAVIRCCESGLLGAKKLGAWFLMPWCIDNITGTDPEYIPITKIAVLAGVNYGRLKWDYKRGNLPAIRHNVAISVPRAEANDIIDIYTKYLTPAEVAAMLNTTVENITFQCEQGIIPSIVYSGQIKIARADAEKIDQKKMPYLDTMYVAETLGVNTSAVHRYATEGKIKNAIKYEETYIFPRKNFKDYLAEQKKYVPCFIVAEICGIKQEHMSERCKRGKIPGAEKRDGHLWKMPLANVGEFMCQFAYGKKITVTQAAKCANMTWLGMRRAAAAGKVDIVDENKNIVINEKFTQYLHTLAAIGTKKKLPKPKQQRIPKPPKKYPYKPVDPATSPIRRAAVRILLRIASSTPEFAVSRCGLEQIGTPSHIRFDYNKQENNISIIPCEPGDPKAQEVKYARAAAAGQHFIAVYQGRKFWNELRNEMELEDNRAFWEGELRAGGLIFDLSRYELWKSRKFVRSVGMVKDGEKG